MEMLDFGKHSHYLKKKEFRKTMEIPWDNFTLDFN